MKLSYKQADTLANAKRYLLHETQLQANRYACTYQHDLGNAQQQHAMT